MQSNVTPTADTARDSSRSDPCMPRAESRNQSVGLEEVGTVQKGQLYCSEYIFFPLVFQEVTKSPRFFLWLSYGEDFINDSYSMTDVVSSQMVQRTQAVCSHWGVSVEKELQGLRELS